VDANVPPQKIDIEFINWLGEMQVPFVITYTKIDRLKAADLATNISNFQNTLLEQWEQLPQQFFTSSNSGDGRPEILNFIENINQSYFE
ncbi:MAG: YihA family ribosome biogenesis GTP-binding protein, partial [Bacteroidota bacterium]